MDKIKLNIKRYTDYESRFVPIRYLQEVAYQNEFDLPSTQREKAWSETQYIQFIESIFKNIPVGSLIFNKKDRKRYILDGQHRIHAITEFLNGNINLDINSQKISFAELDDVWVDFFLCQKIPIIEYQNLSDAETEEIIISINDGVQNECVNIPIIKQSTSNLEMNSQLDRVSQKLFNKLYEEIDNNIYKQNIQKLISYIGWILLNCQEYSNNSYKLLNNTQARKFQEQFSKLDEIKKQDLISQMELNCDIIFNHLDDYNKLKELNNNIINCLLYKIIEINRINLAESVNLKTNKVNLIINKIIEYNDSRLSFYNLLLKFDFYQKMK
jgi:hypothetical protein